MLSNYSLSYQKSIWEQLLWKKHSWGIWSPNILRIIEQFRSGRTSEGHLIQTVPQRRNNCKVSSSCSGPCSGAFWKPPRLEDKQFLCLTTHCILFFPVCLFSNRISLAATCDHCHLSFCYTTLTTAWFYLLCHLLVFLLQKGEPLASVTPLSSEIKKNSLIRKMIIQEAIENGNCFFISIENINWFQVSDTQCLLKENRTSVPRIVAMCDWKALSTVPQLLWVCEHSKNRKTLNTIRMMKKNNFQSHITD